MRSSNFLTKDDTLKLYRRTSVGREYVSTELNCRRISVIVHRSASDELAVDSLVLLVCGPSLILPKRWRERVSGKLFPIKDL